MAIIWHYIGENLALGVEWNEQVHETYVEVSPEVYRWDRYDTDNADGRFSETLSPDPNGGGHWSGLDFGSGYGERVVDTFSKRTYGRESMASIIVLKIDWTDIGTAYESGFHSLGDGSHAWTFDIPAVKYEAPGDPVGVSASRLSDSRASVSWSEDGAGVGGIGMRAGVYVERSTDGGEWSRIADVFSSEATSYDDLSTSANHWYRYRITAYGPGGESNAVEAPETIYNTPAAPASVTARRLSASAVSLAISNPANTATALELQRSEDGALWEGVAEIDGTVTDATDEPGAGTFYYRARNTRGELASDWSPTSNAAVDAAPPSAPTLLAPASGSVVKASLPTVEFKWAHNPVDGSVQEAAELRLSTDGGSTWETVAIYGDAASYAVSNDFTVNSAVAWEVRTKGAHGDFGPWSGNRVFYVYQEPSVAFASPPDGFVIENMPVTVYLQYDDQSGMMANAKLTVSEGGRVVYSRDMGESVEARIHSFDWLPENGAEYEFSVVVRSTSGLTATAVRRVTVSFAPPRPAGVLISNDPDTGYARLVAYVAEGDGEHPSSIAIWREHRGRKVFLADGLYAGSSFVDRYAPINSEYSYIVASIAASGAVNSSVFPTFFESQWFYFMQGSDVAKGRINPAGSRKVTRPNRRQVHFAGRQLPVSFDDGSVSDERSVSMLLRSKDEADAFERMVWERGRCVYKSGDGDVMHADVDISDKQEWTKPTYYGSVSVSLTRIDGRDL